MSKQHVSRGPGASVSDGASGVDPGCDGLRPEAGPRCSQAANHSNFGCPNCTATVGGLEREMARLRDRAESAERWAAEHGRPFPGKLVDGYNDVLARVREVLGVPTGVSIAEEARILRERLDRHFECSIGAEVPPQPGGQVVGPAGDADPEARERALDHVRQQVARAEAAESRAAALARRVEALTAVLRDVEWAAEVCTCCEQADDHAGCPSCGAWETSAAGRRVHAPDCALAAALSAPAAEGPRRVCLLLCGHSGDHDYAPGKPVRAPAAAPEGERR